MRVLISGISENNKIRGVERYVIETCRYLGLNHPTIKLTLLAGDWQDYYDELAVCGVRVVRVPGLKNRKLQRHLFHMYGIRRYAKDCDVLHVANTLPVIKSSLYKTVVTIHDIAEFYVPSKYSAVQVIYRKAIAFLAARQSDLIVTVSNFSREAIAERFSISKAKIVVTYNGVDHLKLGAGAVEGVSAGVSALQPYVLYFGVVERTKGVEKIVFSVEKLRAQGVDLRVIIAGRQGNASEDLEKIYQSRRDWVDILGHVPDEKLINLISAASAVVFPSEYEGFGLPAVEAFLYQNNIVASNSTALGEVTRRFAIQVDPSSIDSIAEGVGEAVSNPRIFGENQRMEILSEFSWSASVDLLVNSYGELVK